jgi:hypothetical protein
MVTTESIEQQLEKIGVNYQGWGRTEMYELPDIILPDEEIFECVNGVYEGGFALLVATNFRVLLIDKKPLRYLTVEDLRFDMISEIDYSRRLLAARISVSTGSKNLRFVSLNQPRLRKLIGHVQHRMAHSKKKQEEHSEDQRLHLEQINRRLQKYLRAQNQQQQKLHEYITKDSDADASTEIKPIKPDPALADYLYAQSLLAEHQRQGGNISADELYQEGVREVFGNRPVTTQKTSQQHGSGLEVNPLRIAYSKLPLAMRNKKFGRPSFHAHSQEAVPLAHAE